MAFTLSEMLQRMFRELGQLNIGKATGGSTTTVIDTTLSGKFADGFMVDGAMFIVRDSAGASAAPEGEFNRISAYVDSTQTFTVDTAFTSGAGSGDTYGYASQLFPLQQMIQSANDGLLMLGDVALVDTTTLETAGAQTEYAWAVAWKRRPPYRIDIQGKTGDANDNQWEQLFRWHPIPATSGTAGLIVFEEQLSTGLDLRIWYRDRHPTVNAFSDKIHETIDPETAVLAGAYKALQWMITRDQGSNAFWVQKANDLKSRYDIRMAQEKPWRPRKSPRLMTLGSLEPEEDYFTYPTA